MDRPDIERMKAFVQAYCEAQQTWAEFEGDYTTAEGQLVQRAWDYQRNTFPFFGSTCLEDLLAYVEQLERERDELLRELIAARGELSDRAERGE